MVARERRSFASGIGDRVLKRPLVFIPEAKRRVWGGTRLISRSPNQIAPPVGESWEIYDHGGASSVVRAGRDGGRTLHELFKADPGEFCCDAIRDAGFDHFILFLKLIETCQDMSVHVHPDDATAEQIQGKKAIGKNEAWYILEAEPDARIFCGLSKAMSGDELRRLAAKGELENYLNVVPVQSGDFIPVPAGTIHAIGKGITLLETTQSGSQSFRLYDWNRLPARELHLDLAVRSALRQKQSLASIRMLKPKSGEKRQVLLTQKDFTVEQISLDYKTPEKFVAEEKTCRILFTLMGLIVVSTGDETLELGPWQSCLFPTSIREFTLTGMRENCKALLFSV